jgi:hypothetical protein
MLNLVVRKETARLKKVNGSWQRTIPYTVLGLTTLALVDKWHKLKAI